MSRAEEIRKRLKDINKEQRNLDKRIEKQEEDGNFDSSLYESVSALEDEYNNLDLELRAIESTM